MSANFEENVGFGDDRVEISNFARYKGVKGQTDRIAFLSPTIKRVHTHFHNGQYFRCLTDETDMGICCENLGSPQQRFGAVIFHYTTDPEGNIIDDNKLQGAVKIWPFSETKYADLSGFHRKWPLLPANATSEQYDLEILCTEDNFQKMTFTPCREAHWKKTEQWYDQIMLKAQKAQERMGRMMGKELNETDVKTVLELSNVKSMADIQPQGNDIDLDDLLPT